MLYNKAVLTLNQLQALVDDISNGKGSMKVTDDTICPRERDGVPAAAHR